MSTVTVTASSWLRFTRKTARATGLGVVRRDGVDERHLAVLGRVVGRRVELELERLAPARAAT